MMLTKESIMKQFVITQDQIDTKHPIIMEKLFCVAILNQGTDIAEKIFAEYNKLKDIIYEVK